MAEFPNFLDPCESSQPLPNLFSLPSGTIKLVRTGFPCEVADPYLHPFLAEDQSKKRFGETLQNIIRSLI